MKYAILSYEEKKLKLDGNDKQNMGDWIQVIAAEMLFEEFGINDYMHISRNSIQNYTGQEISLLYNGWNSFSDLEIYENRQFPIPSNILPVFFSFNLEGTYVPDKAIEQMKLFGPIGCRDEGTVERLKKYDIPCFLSGCITSLLPQRVNDDKQTKTIVVDIPIELEKMIPQELMETIEYRTNMYKVDRITGEKVMTREEAKKSYNAAKEQLVYLRDNAKLVITGRLHVAAPCIAMGIPVVLVKKNYDERFAWIEKYIKPYSEEEWKDIDWNPKPVEYEQEKKHIKEILKEKLLTNRMSSQSMEYFDAYYKKRKKVNYNSNLNQGFMKLSEKIRNFEKYAICGVALDVITMLNVIGKILPELVLCHVYDSSLGDGKIFEGVKIEHSSEIVESDDILYIIATRKAEKQLGELVEAKGLHYVIIDYDKSEWVNNLM